MLGRALTTCLTAGAVVLLAAPAKPVALGAGEGKPIRSGRPRRRDRRRADLAAQERPHHRDGLTQQIGGACVIGGSAQGGPDL